MFRVCLSEGCRRGPFAFGTSFEPRPRPGSSSPKSSSGISTGAAEDSTGPASRAAPTLRYHLDRTVTRCPRCNTEVPVSGRFCPACGQAVSGSLSASPHGNGLGAEARTAEAPVLRRAARLVRLARPRRVSAGRDARRALPHRRPPRQGRHGRGLPRRRPQARPGRRAEVPPEGRLGRRDPPRALPRRGPPRPPGLPPERLPHLRHRRGRGKALPLDGVRGRRRPGLAAEADRPPARGQGGRHRAPALRGPARRAREGRPPPRPQARQRDARRPRARPDHRLRPRDRGRRSGERRRALRHAGVHGARAARGQARLGPERPLRARPRPVRGRHGQAGLRRADARRAAEQARAGDADGSVQRPRRASTRPSSA